MTGGMGSDELLMGLGAVATALLAGKLGKWWLTSSGGERGGRGYYSKEKKALRKALRNKAAGAAVAEEEAGAAREVTHTFNDQKIGLELDNQTLEIRQIKGDSEAHKVDDLKVGMKLTMVGGEEVKPGDNPGIVGANRPVTLTFAFTEE